LGSADRGDRQSAVERRPADVVSQPLIVQDELANRIGQLLALPLALEPASALGLALKGSCTYRLDRVSSSTEFVCGHMPDCSRLTGSVRSMPSGTMEIPSRRIGVAGGCARLPPGDLAAHPLPGQRDIDIEARRLHVRHTLARLDGRLVLLEPKTERSRRSIVIPEVVVAALRAHRTRQRMERLVAGSRWVDSDHVFATTIGTPIEAAAVTRSFQCSLARAGLPHSRFHDLRHAAATFLLAQGFTLEDVKNLLGHSSKVVTSNTYGHVLEQRQHDVARGMDAVLGG